MSLSQVLVVMNKWWEFDPVMNVLLHDKARPQGLTWPEPLIHPRRRPDQKNLSVEKVAPQPRAVFNLKGMAIEMWCISDLLEHMEDAPKYQSSSQRKTEQLPKIFAGKLDALVIAVGTAGYPDAISHNGSVVIGTKVFMHNCHPSDTNPDSNWSVGPFDTPLDSSLGKDVFAKITNLETSAASEVSKRFMVPPLNPAKPQEILADYDAVALGAVNVTDYKEYDKTDAETIAAYAAAKCEPTKAMSLETTHGLVRSYGGDSFLFVSGITDRVGHFGDEVNPREYAQNTSAAHNAGVVLAWMLPKIAALCS